MPGILRLVIPVRLPLYLVKIPVNASVLQKLFVGALFCNLSFRYDKNPVGLPYGGKPMGNDKGGPRRY